MPFGPTKHRALYEAHIEEAVAGLYERAARLALQLDRHYAHPAMRAWLWVRRLVRREQTR